MRPHRVTLRRLTGRAALPMSIAIGATVPLGGPVNAQRPVCAEFPSDAAAAGPAVDPPTVADIFIAGSLEALPILPLGTSSYSRGSLRDVTADSRAPVGAPRVVSAIVAGVLGPIPLVGHWYAGDVRQGIRPAALQAARAIRTRSIASMRNAWEDM